MSDLYTEVLVKKQQTGKDKVIKGVLIFFTVLFAAAGIMMNPLILLLALVLGIVDYIFIPKLSVEFEYLYVNGELDIDRIYSQSRRKRAASYELSNMEILAPYQSHQLDSYKKNQSIKLWFLVEVPPGFEPGIEVLQTFALPLGYGTMLPLLDSNQRHCG